MPGEGVDPATVTVSFPGTGFAPLVLARESELSAVLTVENSPMLFGCRTGICGTCLCEARGEVPGPGPEEVEVLDLMVPGRAGARLACQIRLVADVSLRRIEPTG